MAYGTAVAAIVGGASAIIQGQSAKKDQKAAEAASAEAVQGILNIEEENAFKALEAVKAPNIDTIASDRQQQITAEGAELLADRGQDGAGAVTELVKDARATTLDTAEKQAAAKYEHEMGVAESIAKEEARISKDAALREKGVYEAQALGAGQAVAEAKNAKTATDKALFASAGSLAGEFGNLLGDGGDDES